MDHQDWKPVILRKNNTKHVKKKETVLSNKKSNSNMLNNNLNLKKLDVDDVKPPEHVSKSIGKEIQQARCAIKMTQQDLANKLCVKKNIINDLESGKMLNNKVFIRKVKNILGIK